MTREKLIDIIMKQCEKDGEPVTKEEAAEMADMEIKAGKISHYEKSDKPRKKSTKERKIDTTKKHLLTCVKVLLEGMGADIETVKTETEIIFNYGDDNYSIKLIKHKRK